MTFELRAPSPNLQTTTVLPNPDFSDQEALTSEVSTKRSLNGTVRTYVKTKNNRRKLQWTFNLTRNKSLELRAFINSYFASKIEIKDHRNRVWTGNFINNPFEFEGVRVAKPAIAPWPVGETYSITLEFEGAE